MNKTRQNEQIRMQPAHQVTVKEPRTDNHCCQVMNAVHSTQLTSGAFSAIGLLVTALVLMFDEMIFISDFLMRNADSRAAGVLYQHSFMILDTASITCTLQQPQL